jgi:sigma54-dependent transcription regulator
MTIPTLGSMARAAKNPFVKGLQGADLTAKQRVFVTVLVRNGCTPTQAARDAGYADAKVSAYDLLRTPHIQNAVKFERQRYVAGDLANIATETLRLVMVDQDAPASARVQAARTVLELAGELGKSKSDGVEDRPLSELSSDDLTRLIGQWQDERAELTRVLPGEDAGFLDAVDRPQLAY